MTTKKAARAKSRQTATSKGSKPEEFSPQALAKDLRVVFTRHGWQGFPADLTFSKVSEFMPTCTGGDSPVPMTITCADGSCKIVYVCPGDDPTC
jgi:hypothetical protein